MAASDLCSQTVYSMVLVNERSRKRLVRVRQADPLGRKVYLSYRPIETHMLEGGSLRDVLQASQKFVRGSLRQARKALPFVGKEALANILPLVTGAVLDKTNASADVRKIANNASSLAQREIRKSNRKADSKMEAKASELISNESKRLLGNLLGQGATLIGNGFQNVTVRRE